MIRIGEYNTLAIKRLTDFGAYLDAGDGVEILIPSKYLTVSPIIGEKINVFVYTDSEDRLIATTQRPLIRVGQFAFLYVKDVNPRVGAFLDWGLDAKDLLCPFNEQRTKMKVGGVYCVYAYLDDVTKRVVASSKIEKYLGNVYPCYQAHEKVRALIVKRTDIGYQAILNNLHLGMIYDDELISELEIGSEVDAFVKKIREDGKIDLTMKDTNGNRARNIANDIIDMLNSNFGVIHVTDKSTPEEIANVFGCSKKDFKKAVGYLYKQQLIALLPGEIRLTTNNK